MRPSLKPKFQSSSTKAASNVIVRVIVLTIMISWYDFSKIIIFFQHMNSPKHHVKAAEGQKSTEKLKEIPMLNMFLKTLQPPQNYFPSNQEKETEESSSNTEVER